MASGSFRAAEGARCPEEHIEYSPFEVDRFYETLSHKRRSGFRIYPGVVGEAD